MSGLPRAEAEERAAASSKWFLDRYFSGHTRGPFIRMSAQNGGVGKDLTEVALEVRGAAQLTVPANVNLNRRVQIPPKLRIITHPANDTTSLLQRPRLGCWAPLAEWACARRGALEGSRSVGPRYGLAVRGLRS